MNDELKSMPLKIAEYIKEQIESGQLKVGEKLHSERTLVKELQVSRSSVREAVKHLITMGYLQSIERRGTFVCDDYLHNTYASADLNKALTMAPILDLMEVRMLLEEKFISLAIKRITKEDIDNLRSILEKIKCCHKNMAEFLKLDLEFHLTLAKSTHNDIIVEIMKIIIKRINENEEAFEKSGVETKESTVKDFEKIIDYLEVGNGEEAEKLYHNHIHLIDNVLKEQFE
ncbi:FadR/GntR family transcriptional regulator [Anaeromicrobium sediminis]|uniref:HTH gntR-type domain-containing protein n=1 Tax=Anaeromicrobium sediminis TaxID=1478221 RepID=A0A267MK98_9FIRM|nr:FCD domain-containing protein [Anaeromicrobium sediminis]PAB59999.1 hypothetical protein CCE28_06385 [Anaeromicrobium sediminis]